MIRLPALTDHGSEIGLLALLGLGVLVILGIGAWNNTLSGDKALDVAAFLLVLQRIVEAVQKRWEQRSLDRTTAQIGQAKTDAPTGTPADPLNVKEAP